MTYDDIKPNTSYSAYTTDGILVFGDRKSIERVKLWHHEATNVEAWWRPNYLRLQQQLLDLKTSITKLL